MSSHKTISYDFSRVAGRVVKAVRLFCEQLLLISCSLFHCLVCNEIVPQPTPYLTNLHASCLWYKTAVLFDERNAATLVRDTDRDYYDHTFLQHKGDRATFVSTIGRASYVSTIGRANFWSIYEGSLILELLAYRVSS